MLQNQVEGPNISEIEIEWIKCDMAMNVERIQELLRNGEGLSVEFKRCSGRIEHDVFETICAFGSWFDGRCMK